MKNKHYIYEIFGKKIGATNDVKKRMYQQNIKDGEYRVIEEHTNAKTASIREQELQKQHGYPVDKLPYWKTLKWQKKGQTSQSQAKRVANIDYQSFQAKRIANTDFKAKVANTDYKAKAIKCEKSVLQFDKQGNFIKQWDSASKAGIKLNIGQPNINGCLRGRIKSAGGYIWKYAN
jgi:hypothetical protein